MPLTNIMRIFWLVIVCSAFFLPSSLCAENSSYFGSAPKSYEEPETPEQEYFTIPSSEVINSISIELFSALDASLQAQWQRDLNNYSMLYAQGLLAKSNLARFAFLQKEIFDLEDRLDVGLEVGGGLLLYLSKIYEESGLGSPTAFNFVFPLGIRALYTKISDPHASNDLVSIGPIFSPGVQIKMGHFFMSLSYEFRMLFYRYLWHNEEMDYVLWKNSPFFMYVFPVASTVTIPQDYVLANSWYFSFSQIIHLRIGYAF